MHLFHKFIVNCLHSFQNPYGKKSSFCRVKLNLDVFKYMYMLKHEIDFYLVKKIFLTGFSRGKIFVLK